MVKDIIYLFESQGLVGFKRFGLPFVPGFGKFYKAELERCLSVVVGKNEI